ncbi:MAG: family 20 glycosylhydrolase [Mucilaginibacter sp.]|nr:family 20 glycosylhydrolase [Mucilaginibacter sp.]
MFRKYIFALLVLLVGLCLNASYSFAQENYSLIPYPKSLEPGKGNFYITKQTIISSALIVKFNSEINQLNELFAASLGGDLKVTKSARPTNVINIVYDPAIKSPGAYRLTITPSKITIISGNNAGVFYAIETIRQLLPVSAEEGKAGSKLTLPALTISDEPGYSWRGMHLDVSRHFFSIAYLRRFIDRMALYKMNKFHLHLTDDQGWRIEIKKYPKLTEEGAWRTFDRNDTACMKRSADNPDFTIDKEHIIQKNGKTLYGGYYTQQQMKDLVKYAAQKHVDIIPEIDMPGHMMAAINSYPFLTCNGENTWGQFFTKPICPCNENTFAFAENVFSEIMDIFPSEYIHIGGDEVERSDWAKSDACKALMQREGIKDIAGLESYFINRMEKFFNSKGRKLIGWDEVLEGGISPTANIMYWRTWVPNAPAKAARNGNHVIMTPGSPLYFDNPADKNSIYNVYHFNPIPAGLTPEQAKLIIGAQANVWSENIPSEKRADYMTMPRMTALAEMLWTNNKEHYTSYEKRLVMQFPRMDALNINYRLPDLDGIIDSKVFVESDRLNVTSPLSSLTIRFTTDGTLPQASSPVLNNLLISHTETVKVAAFTPGGKRGDVYAIRYEQQSLAKPVMANKTDTGLKVDYYKGFFKGTTYIRSGQPDSTYTATSIDVPKSVNAPSFGLKYRGYIDVPETGIYTFYLTCDDGGILKIADRLTVDNDGLHSAIEKTGQVALSKGLQPFALDFIEGGGGFTLKLKYSFNGSEPKDIPQSWFRN